MSQISPAAKLFAMCLVVALCSSYAVAQISIIADDGQVRLIRTAQAGAYTLPPTGSYLGLDGISGSGPDGAIAVRDLGFGSSSSMAGRGTGGGAGAGRSSVEPLIVVKDIDASTPMLFLAALNGRTIPSGAVRLDLPNGSVQITMRNVTVVGTGRPADAAQPLPAGQERITLVAQEYIMRYQPTVGDPVEAGWNVSENRQL